jgi:hypothetical protein
MTAREKSNHVVVQGTLAAAAAEIVPNGNFHASCSTQLFVGLAEAVARVIWLKNQDGKW